MDIQKGGGGQTHYYDKSFQWALKWTATLIPNLVPWIIRTLGDVDYFLTQFLTGHRYFTRYLWKMSRVVSPICIYCNSRGDVYHTFFESVRWNEERNKAETEIRQIKPQN